jgi:hypothetical protein
MQSQVRGQSNQLRPSVREAPNEGEERPAGSLFALHRDSGPAKDRAPLSLGLAAFYAGLGRNQSRAQMQRAVHLGPEPS